MLICSYLPLTSLIGIFLYVMVFVILKRIMYIASTIFSALKLLSRFGIFLHAGIKSHIYMYAGTNVLSPFISGSVKSFRQNYLPIEITVAIHESAKSRSNVVLTLDQRRKQLYNIQLNERQLTVLTGAPLNVFPFDKQI